MYWFGCSIVHRRVSALIKILGVLVALSPSFLRAASPMDNPTPEIVAQAKQIVAEMITNPRGPYSKILWYCKDGTTQPPVAYACSSRGGGQQHAEFSSKQQQLASMGWTVGTIYAPLNFAGLRAQAPRDARLRELALERYMMDIDDGWVLRRALSYRGRVQLEDEIRVGRKILLDALADKEFSASNYLLLRELVRTIPHGQENDLARDVRRAAVELAELEPIAEAWRAEIHSSPSPATAGKLRHEISKLRSDTAVRIATTLADNLDRLYGEQGRTERLEQALKALKSPQAKAWGQRVSAQFSAKNELKVKALCALAGEVRGSLIASLPSEDALAVLDSLSGIETEVQIATAQISQKISRAKKLSLTRDLLRCGYAAGLLSAREVASVRTAIDFPDPNTVSFAAYQAGINQLRRIPSWSAANVRFEFGEALTRYSALDSRALRFTDDLLRGSPLSLLGALITDFGQDLGDMSGSEVDLFGQKVASAFALNPGVARGKLRIFDTIDAAEHAIILPSEIVVLPETIAELKPVAGILTLGEGNALSHVQLLARNFGIPNIAIEFSTLDLLRKLEGREVVMLVSNDGNAIVRAAAEAAVIEEALGGQAQDTTEQITVPRPNLARDKILTLGEISRKLSGKVIGPKAANLGELNRLFPGKVAPALAIPFGVYAKHLDSVDLRQRIAQIYTSFKAGEINKEELNQQLAGVRESIAKLTLNDETLREIKAAMRREFGEVDDYGIFVRSDTNVEDLPQFTGAGLSETVANVVGFDTQMRTVPRVWASVLSPRALAWRSSLLANPEEIYASVLLMKSVPSNKSGVLVTANLATPGASGLTVSTAWGVGGAVNGEAAEGLVLQADGTTLLVSEAKTPYKRHLSARGGVDWLPAKAGRVLTDDEIQQLRELARQVAKKYDPVFDEFGRQRPWDIEFGFVEGALTLFQIRPLVERSARRADLAMERLRPARDADVMTNLKVDLSAAGDRW